MPEPNLISITEMARRRGITTETLRHYDRIGLVKPAAKNQYGVRYYSLRQAEQLETIKELTQIGLSLQEIGDYLQHRTVATSYQLLVKQEAAYRAQLARDRLLLRLVTARRKLIEEVQNQEGPEQPRLRPFGERRFLRGPVAKDEPSLGAASMELEERLKGTIPTLPAYATAQYAGLVNRQAGDPAAEILFLLDPDQEVPDSETLPAGDYLCLTSHAGFWERDDALAELTSYAGQHRLQLADQGLLISRIDYSITDDPAERVVEYQFLVKKR